MFYELTQPIADAKPARRLVSLFLFLALFCIFLVPSNAVAQSGQGSIVGKVTDASGAVVAHATLVITNTATGVTNTTQTNSGGEYNVEALNPGPYKIEATANGFKTEIVDKITVSTGNTVDGSIKLSVGGKSEVVTVTSVSSLLTRDVSDVITTVDHEIVENLPYPERSSLEAVLLVPGVTGDTLNPGGIEPENPNAYTNYFAPGASISIGGAPPGSAAIIIDGSDVTESSYPRAGINLGGRMVQETSVIVAGASAQYGRTGGGAIVQSSRGGTSQYHGAVTWKHTDPYFWAITPASTKTKVDQHEQFYGFYLGGPVKIPKIYNGTDRTFFYVGYEPATIHNQFYNRGILITPAMLQGQFHNSLELLNSTTLKTSGYAAALAQARIGGVGYDEPHGGSPSDSTGLFPFGAIYSSTSSAQQINGPLADCTAAGITQADIPGSTVCHDDLSAFVSHNAFAQAVIGYLPSPTNPGPYVSFDSPDGASATDGTNGTFKRGVINNDHRYSFRIDHQFNNSNKIFVRYTTVPVDAERFLGYGSTNPLNQVPTDVEHGYDVAIGYTHIFSNTVVNNAHYSWFRENLQRLPPLSATTQDFAKQYGLTPAVVGYGFPKVGSFAAGGAGTYSLQVGAGSGSYSQQIDQNFILTDDLTWVRGAHNMSFGFDIRWLQSNQFDLGGLTGGTYSFSATQSQAPNGQATPTIGGGSAFGSFLMGVQNGNSNYTNTPVEVPGYYRYKYWAGYVQDNWRASAKVTLNLGLRYEVQVPREEAHNNQAFVGDTSIPGTLNGIATNTAFCFSGACGLGKSLWPTNYWGLEPRIGIAYAMNPKTTIRASYSLSRTPLSGQENIPDPNFNVSGTGSNVYNSNYLQDYISNPISAASLYSPYTLLNGRGPFNYSNGLAPVFVDQTKAVPNIQIYNMTIQYQPFNKTLVQATYQGLRGEHLFLFPFIAKNTPSIPTLLNAINQPAFLNATVANPYGITSSPTSTSVANETGYQFLEPYQNFYNQTMPDIYQRTGDLKYNGLYLSVNQRATKTLTLLASYSWSKGLDDIPDTNSGFAAGSGVSAVQSPYSLGSEYSVSTFDQDSNLKAGYNLNLPFGIGQQYRTGKGWIDRLIGNFSTSGTMNWVVGFPNHVALGNQGYFNQVVPYKSTGTVPGAPAGSQFLCNTSPFCTVSVLPSGYTLRPNIVKGVPLILKNWRDNPYIGTAPGGITHYLNTAAFSVPGSYGNPQLGNAPRTLANARSPREFLFDANVKKGFTIRDRYQVNLNVQLNNAFNHPVYFGGSGSVYGSSVTTNTAGTMIQNVNNPAGSQTLTFGNLGNAGAYVMARVIRVGAEFTF